MAITFKKFVTFVEHDGDMTDEQLDEIFGMFKNNAKIDAAKKQKDDLLLKKKELGKKKDALFAKRKAELDAENGGFDPKERGTSTSRNAASSGRAAELDWVRGMTEDKDEEHAEWQAGFDYAKKVRSGKAKEDLSNASSAYKAGFRKGMNEGK